MVGSQEGRKLGMVVREADLEELPSGLHFVT